MRVLAVFAAAACLPLLTACESTQTTSARLKARSKKAAKEEGLKVTKLDKGIKVSSSAMISDPNGTAVVLELRNATRQSLAGVPLALDLADAKGASVYRNDTPGLEASLVSAPLLPARATQVWINDQVFTTGAAKRIEARPGRGGEVVKGELPKILAPAPKLENDPTSGLAAVGKVSNRSAVEQRDLVINVVARKSREIVAAGRAVVRRLRAGKSAKYQAFLIGKPQGARLEASAPPTTLR